jgi:hypothetical protein
MCHNIQGHLSIWDLLSHLQFFWKTCYFEFLIFWSLGRDLGSLQGQEHLLWRSHFAEFHIFKEVTL